jgi:hypothetical protein
MTDASTTIEAVADTIAQVRDHLSSFDDVTVNDDGSATLLWGSARVDVTVGVFDQDQSVVQVKSTCVTGATASPELYEHIATSSLDLGHYSVVAEDGGSVAIVISHGLIGEFLNPAELRMTVVAVAHEADTTDDELAARFGGTVYAADANRG